MSILIPGHPSLMSSQPIHASILDAAAYMLGIMPDFSKGECLKNYHRYMAQVRAGKVQKIRRGVYRITPFVENDVE